MLVPRVKAQRSRSTNLPGSLASIERHLYVEEGFRAASKPPDSIDAWGLVARAVVMLNRFDREQNMEARALLRRAIALEPTYARAHAVLGWATYWATYAYWLPDREESLRQAAAHAQDALQHDATDPWASQDGVRALPQLGGAA